MSYHDGSSSDDDSFGPSSEEEEDIGAASLPMRAASRPAAAMRRYRIIEDSDTDTDVGSGGEDDSVSTTSDGSVGIVDNCVGDHVGSSAAKKCGDSRLSTADAGEGGVAREETPESALDLGGLFISDRTEEQMDRRNVEESDNDRSSESGSSATNPGSKTAADDPMISCPFVKSDGKLESTRNIESTKSQLDLDLGSFALNDSPEGQKETPLIASALSASGSRTLLSSSDGSECDRGGDSSFVACNQPGTETVDLDGTQNTVKKMNVSNASLNKKLGSTEPTGGPDFENNGHSPLSISSQSSASSSLGSRDGKNVCSTISEDSVYSPSPHPKSDTEEERTAEVSVGSPAMSHETKGGSETDYVKDFQDSAWTLDEERNEYFLTGSVDATKGEVKWPRIRVPIDLYQRLYDHQKVGVQWMASLHHDGIGGVLGDDMGLGKTFQTLTFLGGLMIAQTIRSALIVCPVSLLRTWEKEAREILERSCTLDVTIIVLSSDIPKKKRCNLLGTAMNCSTEDPHLVITTYGLVSSSPLDFVRTEKCGEKLAWNYVILDEGHKIKNPSTKATKSCYRVCKVEKTHRLLLTGTPIQNNLKELWALFDWATSGRLLGKLPNFKNRFAQPIEDGRHKNASDSTISIAEKANRELQEVLRPHFLQRLKSVEFKDELPTKRELVVWTHLSDKQRQLYEDYINNGGNVQAILAGDITSPLEAITWLKKLCGHPLLVSWNKTDLSLLQFDDANDNRKALVRDSAKLRVLFDLLRRLRASGHKTLVFSQSTKMLDIMENVLCGMDLARIDGKTKERERQRIVDKFNEEGSPYDVLLLSTKAAGLGLTLTGADRCIVYDPSWNPAEDSQAVDRCFRIGQSKRVTVYRFIAAGTVEERMYVKQVFKDGVRRAVMSSKGSSTTRYFNKDELQRLFQLAPEGECEILSKFRGKQGEHHGCDEDENSKRNKAFVVGASGKPSFLGSHRYVVGLSSHDHLYTTTVVETSGMESVIDEAQSTPFSGTPLKERRLDRAGRALCSGKKLDFGLSPSSESLELASHYVSGEDSARSQAVTLSKLNVVVRERKPLATVDRNEGYINDVKMHSPGNGHKKKSQSSHVEDMMNTSFQPSVKSSCVDLDSQNELEHAMGVLLDKLEREEATGDEKLQLHKQIAHLAVQLEWLQ